MAYATLVAGNVDHRSGRVYGGDGLLRSIERAFARPIGSQ
jgi:hypothetical protein